VLKGLFAIDEGPVRTWRLELSSLSSGCAAATSIASFSMMLIFL